MAMNMIVDNEEAASPDVIDVHHQSMTIQDLVTYFNALVNGGMENCVCLIHTKFKGEESATICEVLSRDKEGNPIDVKPVLVFLTDSMASDLTTADNVGLTVEVVGEDMDESPDGKTTH